MARFVSLARWHAGGMAPCSRNALPVLEEWYDRAVRGQHPYDRPRMCGVAGCAEPLVKARNLVHRLCPAHIKCPAVLRSGVPQRWCSTCSKFHSLKAFSGGRRCAPAYLTLGALCSPTFDSPLQTYTSAFHVGRCSSDLEQSTVLRVRGTVRMAPTRSF